MAKNEIKEKRLEKLYKESVSFRMFVDKNCASYGYTKEFAFKDCIVQSYAEYVMNEQDEDDYAKKECAREYKQDCGC